MYQDVGTHAEIAAQHLCYHDWPVKNAIVHLLIRLKKEKEMHFCYLVESIGAQNKDIGATSQMLLTEVTLRLPRRLQMQGVTVLQKCHLFLYSAVIYFAFDSNRPDSSHNFAVSLTIFPHEARELIILSKFASCV